MHDSASRVLATLGETGPRFLLAEQLERDDELARKFDALEALSEIERPRSVRAAKEILRIFLDGA
jgi:hypothetical protein